MSKKHPAYNEVYETARQALKQGKPFKLLCPKYQECKDFIPGTTCYDIASLRSYFRLAYELGETTTVKFI